MTSATNANSPPPQAAAPQPPRRRLSWRKKLLFTLFTFFLLFAIPEGLTRLFAPRFAHIRSTRQFTCGHPIGKRGADFGYELAVQPKAANERRIVMVGDSVMWGYGLPLDETISAQTERILNAAGQGVFRCVNFAGMGTTPAMRLPFLLEQLGKIPADLLVLQFNINDVGWDDAQAANQMPVTNDGSFSALFSNGAIGFRETFIRNSAFLTLLEFKSRAIYFQSRAAIDPAVCGMAALTDSPAVLARWERQFQAMAKLRDACHAHGIGFRVYMYPASESLSNDPRDDYYHLDRTKFTVDPYQRFDEYCEKYQLSGKHLFAELKSRRDAMLAGTLPYDPLYCYMDDNHPNTTGARIFAEVIAADILAAKGQPPAASQAATPRD